MSVPTLYKTRGLPLKQAVCAICVERTQGHTELVRLTHGVAVWVCAGHASTDFRTKRGGRDFVVTLQRVWHANGCLTTSRRHALEAHLRAQRGDHARPRPGSYAWPALRREVEARLARGGSLHPLLGEVTTRLSAGPARAAQHRNAPPLAARATLARTPPDRRPTGATQAYAQAASRCSTGALIQ